MPIAETAMWSSICDGCQTNITEEGGEYAAWAHHETCVDEIDASGGALSRDGRVACENCKGVYLAELSDDDDRWDAEWTALRDGDDDAMTRLLDAVKSAQEGGRDDD